jgi:hypothetical protein
MAIISCPECSREVSDKASACPHCGYPLQSVPKEGMVRIKLPSNIVEGWIGLFSSRQASICTLKRDILWEGKHGENAKFTIDAPMNIIINLGGWANEVEGLVEPHKKYSLIQDMGAHIFATYRLTEVDFIDAD